MKKIIYIIILLAFSTIAFSQPILRNNGATITTSGAIFMRIENLPTVNSSSTPLTTTNSNVILKNDAQVVVNEQFTLEANCVMTTNDNSKLTVQKDLVNAGSITLNNFSIIAVINDLVNSGSINNQHQIEIGQ